MDIEDCITQLEEVFEGQPWFGPSLVDSLEKISVGFWNQKFKNQKHSIAELVWHMIDWRQFVIEKLKDNVSYSIEMNSEADWRKNASVHNDQDKKNLIQALIQSQEEIIRLLDGKPDSWLQEFVSGKDYKNEYMIQGLVQHDIYHLGQINLLYSLIK